MQDGQIVVIGAGGHGREVVATARAAGLSVAGVLDDGDPDPQLLATLGVAHLGGVGWLADPDRPRPRYVAGLGYPRPRRDVVRRAEHAGARAAPAVVHPTAVLGPAVELGEGCVVWPQVAVTAQVRVGRHTHLNVGCSVSHDSVLGDYVTVGPGARVCGSVVLEDEVWIGAGATVIQGLRVGRGAVVGAGAVVIRDVPEHSVVAGTPARPLTRDGGGELGSPAAGPPLA